MKELKFEMNIRIYDLQEALKGVNGSTLHPFPHLILFQVPSKYPHYFLFSHLKILFFR